MEEDNPPTPPRNEKRALIYAERGFRGPVTPETDYYGVLSFPLCSPNPLLPKRAAPFGVSMRRPLLSAVLLSALVACSSDVEAQLDDLAEEIDELADENDELSAQIDELTSENAALSAELDALSQAEDVDAAAVPLVRMHLEYVFATSYTWTVRADGDGITHLEASVYQNGDPSSLLGEASGQDCATLTLPASSYGGLTVLVWQGDTFTCHSTLDDRCFPIWGSSSVDEC